MDHVWPNTRLISDIFSFLLWKSKSSARVNKALCCEGDCACRTSIYGKGKTVSFFLKYTPLFLNLHTAFSLGLFSFDSSFLFWPTIYSTITIIFMLSQVFQLRQLWFFFQDEFGKSSAVKTCTNSRDTVVSTVCTCHQHRF